MKQERRNPTALAVGGVNLFLCITIPTFKLRSNGV